MNILKKTIKIMTEKEVKSFYFLLVLMVFGAFAEMVGVGLVVPALTLMSNMDSLGDNIYLSRVLNYLGNPEESKLVALGIGLLVFAYLFKMVFLIILNWYQSGFVNGVRASLSLRLFSNYLQKDWMFHTQRNSAKLITILTNETNLFAASHLYSLLNLLSELMVLVFICCLLFFLEPFVTTMMLSILVFFSSVFYISIRTRTKRWGAQRYISEGMRIQWLQQGFGGVKEIILLGREKEFIDAYSIHNAKVSEVIRLQWFFSSLPRLFIEFLIILIFCLMVALLLFQERSNLEILTVLGLFGAASFRLMPSITRLVASIQAIRYSAAVVDTLVKEVSGLELRVDKESNPRPFIKSNPRPFTKSISVKSLDYSYPGSDQLVIKDVNLEIPKGSSLGIIGPSGSGKSTLMDVLMGLLNPQKGQVLVDNVDISIDPLGWREHIGYVPQTIFLTDDSLRRNIAFGLDDSVIDEQRVYDALEKAQLAAFVADLDQGLDTVFGERGVRLSGGQRQRIGIARALYHNPSVLFLDEASSALDDITEREVMRAVNSMMGDKTIIIIAHRLSTVENCDFIYDMATGSVVANACD